MPHYTIRPIDHASPPVEVASNSAVAVLNMVQRLGCGKADVLQDGIYAFSCELDDNGVWSILHSEQDQLTRSGNVPETLPEQIIPREGT